MTDEAPAPGKFVRRRAKEYADSDIYHAIYLPTNWRAGESYPAIVEYAPNRAAAFGTTGRVEDCRLGYHLSGGRDCLWIVLPYVNVMERQNQDTWWGDESATVDYCLANLARECDEFGGDRNSVVLVGFSRGAIACGYIGLRNDDIADIWLGFWAHSHIDGGRFTPMGRDERMARLRGRPTLLSWGETDGGKPEGERGAARLREAGQLVSAFEIAGVGHTDTWIEHDTMDREKARAWLATLLEKRPGTFTVRGRLVDVRDQPIAERVVTCGEWHRSTTDAQGRFEIRGLTKGLRPLQVAPTAIYSQVTLPVNITDSDIDLKRVVVPRVSN